MGVPPEAPISDPFARFDPGSFFPESWRPTSVDRIAVGQTAVDQTAVDPDPGLSVTRLRIRYVRRPGPDSGPVDDGFCCTGTGPYQTAGSDPLERRTLRMSDNSYHHLPSGT